MTRKEADYERTGCRSYTITNLTGGPIYITMPSPETASCEGCMFEPSIECTRRCKRNPWLDDMYEPRNKDK